MNIKIEIALLWLLISAWPAAAQSVRSIIQLEATGEYRTIASEASEAGKQLAVIAARQNLLRDAATRLRNNDEVKAVPLKPGELEALLPAILEIHQGRVQSRIEGTAANNSVTVTVRAEPSQIAHRLEKLRQDPNAVTGLMEVSRQAEALYPLLTGSSSPGAPDLLAARFRANWWMARSYAAIAKTEESPASRRVSSRAGRQRAMQFSEAALLSDPGSTEVRLLLGDALSDLDQAPAAEVVYREAVSMAPASSRAHVKLADALRREEKLPEAIAELREAIRLDPNSAIAHSDLGYTIESQQTIAESISEYRDAIRLDPGLVEPHNYLAVALARQGKIPEAIEEFRKILRIDPESVLGYYNLASALADMEKDAESAEALRYAIHFNPYHFNAHYNVGELLRLEGKLDEAVTQFREYLRLAPVTPQNQRNIQRASEFVRTHENL